MRDSFKKHRYLLRSVMAAVASGLLLWIINAAVLVWVFHRGTFEERIFHPDAYSISTLIIITLAFTGYSILSYCSIAKRRLAEESLKKSKKEREDTFNAITDPVFIHDSDFRIVRANKAYQEAAGMPFEEIIGKPYDEVFPKMEAPFNGCLKALILQEQQQEVTDPFTCKIYKVWFYPIKTDAYKYSVHILEDITEKKKAENELKERLDELERFYRATVGREIMMHEVMEENQRLKAKIKEMEGKKI
ncbi:MAG: PAS domain-containing protein [Thermodesulfovibrionales bacterium]|nr:PAS domain-containing protein [Thermodesulfovibrionales bacterium]